jgi:uncharacterized protein
MVAYFRSMRQVESGAQQMNIVLPPNLEEYLRRKLATGPYNDASEIVREALWLMFEREAGGRPAPKKADIVAALRALEPTLRERGVSSAAVFGSIARDQSGPHSDIDVLVYIGPTVEFNLIDLISLKHLLGDRLGYEIDVVDKGSLKPTIRDRVLAEAETVF